MKRLHVLSIPLLLLMACGAPEQVPMTMNQPTTDKAVAVLHPIGDSGVSGVVFFEQTETGVSVTAEVNGLSGTNHGFHIHQYGDCTADDGTSAGGHFNPADMQHAGPDDENRHMGDMGNIEANAEGMATKSYVDGTINIMDIIGRGVIVHAGEDDLTSQPSGAAGPRVSCGVIGIQN